MQRDEVTWAVLATDGAAEFIDHASDGEDWPALAQFDSDQLAQVLACIQEWEMSADPNGENLPRAKRHDDKTIATIHAL